MPIQILPSRLANQIAAGEVVERPASVVKELVENALDAGATMIDIEIEKGGAQLIRIRDNGSGIPKDELTLALSRHATSKIQSLDDLEAIVSMGFRGEALASISSVSRLTLTSRTESQSEAWQAFAEGQDMAVTVKPAAHPTGTTIEVADLFFNTPARRKFLRTEKTEFQHIDELIKRIALSFEHTQFTLQHNGKIVRQFRRLRPGQDSMKRIQAVCGKRFTDNAIRIDCDYDDMHLQGWILADGIGRPANDLCYSYVNGRMMRDKLINHAVRQAYEGHLAPEHYPAFVLKFVLPPTQVDVNVHPAKHEVRFHQTRLVHDFIAQAVMQGLQSQASIVGENHDMAPDEQPGTNFSSPHLTQTAHQPGHDMYGELRPASGDAQTFTSSRGDHAPPLSQGAPVNRATGGYRASTPNNLAERSHNYQALMSVPDAQNAEPEQPVETTAAANAILVGNDEQAVIQHQHGVYLLSLTLAYRDLQWQQLLPLSQGGLVPQPLLLPVRVKVSAGQMQLLQEKIELLTQLGVMIRLQSPNIAIIQQVPAWMRELDVAGLFHAFVERLSELEGDELLKALVFSQQEPLTSVQKSEVLANSANWSHWIPQYAVAIDLATYQSKLKGMHF